MCLNPIPIKQSNKDWVAICNGKVLNKSSHYVYKSDSPVQLVPCGHCAECMQKKQQDKIQMMREVSKDYYMFFNTLTYGDWRLEDDEHSTTYKQTKEEKKQKLIEFYLKKNNKTQLADIDIDKINEYYNNLFINQETGEIYDEIDIYEFTDKFANKEDIQKMIRRIRDNWTMELLDKDGNEINSIRSVLKYSYYSEYGKNTHRPHWHGLLMIPKYCIKDEFHLIRVEKYLDAMVQKYWAKKVGGTRKNPIYEANSEFFKVNPLRPYGHYTYDFHLVTERMKADGSQSDMADVSFYITKYMLKCDEWLSKKQQALKINYDADTYKKLWAKLKNKALCSKSIDKICPDRITDMIRATYKIYGYPCYINDNGDTYALSQRYKKKYITEQILEKYDNNLLWNNDSVSGYSNPDLWNIKDELTIENKKRKFKKILKEINDRLNC